MCLVTAVLLGFGTLLLRSRTAEGAQRASEWKAFERKLRDFSQMEDAPAGHLILWERYLVYAVALGVSQRLAHGLGDARARRAAVVVRALVRRQRRQLTRFGGMADFGSSFGGAVHSAMVAVLVRQRRRFLGRRRRWRRRRRASAPAERCLADT